MQKIWNLEQYQDNLALADEYGNSLTYRQMVAETDRIAKAVRERCLVFCLCRNEIGSILGYVSFVNHGIVPVLLNSHLEETLLDNLLHIYEPSYLWIPKDQYVQFQNMDIILERYGYLLLRTDFSNKYPLYDDLALLLTTSGSTGSPKFVRQSYENILDNAKSIVKYLELDETERPITTLPMNYTYGLSIINSHLLVGAAILVTEKTLMQKEFWKFFQ